MNLRLRLGLGFFFLSLGLCTFAYAKSTFTETSYLYQKQQGRVHVECDDGLNQTYNSFWCEGSYLSPSEAEYFATDKRADLHQVTLSIRNHHGLSKIERRLNSMTGRTWLRIPLWGNLGILSLGTNTIDYSVESSEGTSLEKGRFVTEVIEAPMKECRPIWIRSTNPFDCQMPSYACQQLNWHRMDCQ